MSTTSYAYAWPSSLTADGLDKAQALVAAGAVRDADDHMAVTSGGTVSRVRVTGGTPAGSTRRWWGRHRGSRGPCKHQLAVLIARRAPAEVTQ